MPAGACLPGLQVSIHASSREDATLRRRSANRHTKFQSTRPRGRTRLCSPDIITPGMVSIHASSREDATFARLFRCRNSMFQSTRPRGRTRLVAAVAEDKSAWFQSTRPRGRTRQEHNVKELGINVSIHASSREDATVSVESNINQNVTFAKARRK